MTSSSSLSSSSSKEDVVSYNTSGKQVVHKHTSKLQQVPTKVYASQLERARALAIIREGKINGALMRVCIEIFDIGLREMESKQHHSTTYAISGKSGYRADKASRLIEIQKEIRDIWSDTQNYPVLHLNQIRSGIKAVCIRTNINDPRTMFTSQVPPSYQKIIIDLSKNVGTSRWDITGFMEHDFT